MAQGKEERMAREHSRQREEQRQRLQSSMMGACVLNWAPWKQTLRQRFTLQSAVYWVCSHAKHPHGSGSGAGMAPVSCLGLLTGNPLSTGRAVGPKLSQLGAIFRVGFNCGCQQAVLLAGGEMNVLGLRGSWMGCRSSHCEALCGRGKRTRGRVGGRMRARKGGQEPGPVNLLGISDGI